MSFFMISLNRVGLSWLVINYYLITNRETCQFCSYSCYSIFELPGLAEHDLFNFLLKHSLLLTVLNNMVCTRRGIHTSGTEMVRYKLKAN